MSLQELVKLHFNEEAWSNKIIETKKTVDEYKLWLDDYFGTDIYKYSKSPKLVRVNITNLVKDYGPFAPLFFRTMQYSLINQEMIFNPGTTYSKNFLELVFHELCHDYDTKTPKQSKVNMAEEIPLNFPISTKFFSNLVIDWFINTHTLSKGLQLTCKNKNFLIQNILQ